MRRKTKVWLGLATSLVVLGGLLFVGGMTALKWDFTKLTTAKYETNGYVLTEEYRNISIVTDTADVVFVPTDGETTEVVCYEQEKIKHTVTVKDGALTVEVVDTRAWYEHIGINFVSPTITVKLPRGEYGLLQIRSSTGDVEIPRELSFGGVEIYESTGDVRCYASVKEQMKVKTSTGAICVEDVSIGAMELSVTTGKITVRDVACRGEMKIYVTTGDANLTNVRCERLVSDGSTGSIRLDGVIASERFEIARVTGSVRFDGCDAGEIFVRCSTGSVTGSLLTAKSFDAHATTGRVQVPQGGSGGVCEIRTTTGDIILSVG